ncbi:MAG: hypothetical protein XU15_C0011G0140 [candidate division NC10 bacterium CSP1-5]|nr:MAG: hypothetical protein XU15_C0011G0140 [candidate division NC10 bacterium CSP1-5]
MSAHYRQIQEAVAGALKYEYYQAERLKFGNTFSMVPESALFPEGVQKMPEVYWLYRKCRTWNSLWWPGGVASQPHILMNEFEACASGESDFREWMDQVLEQKFQQGNGKNDLQNLFNRT